MTEENNKTSKILSNVEYLDILFKIDSGVLIQTSEITKQIRLKRLSLILKAQDNHKKRLDKIYNSHYNRINKIQKIEKYTLIGFISTITLIFIIFISL